MENADSDDRLGQEIVYIYIYTRCVWKIEKKANRFACVPTTKACNSIYNTYIYTFLASADLANVKKYGNSRSLFFTLDGSNSLTFFHFGRWLRDVNYSEC